MLLFPGLAFAATVTDVPSFLRGDARLGYAWERTSGSLVERSLVDGLPVDTEVGQRAVDSHAMTYHFEFAPGPGVAVFLAVPHYLAQSVGYGATGTMVYDPATSSGTYVGTDAGETGTYVNGAGLGGVWLGARGTPFSEAFESRGNRATWLVELAFRTADKTNFWVEGDARGAGSGSSAVRLASAFSTTIKRVNPYTSLNLTWEAPIEVASGLEVDPGTRAAIRVGAELIAGQNAASGGSFRFDLHGNLGYQAAGTVPSGVYLPNVLDLSSGSLVQTAEQLAGGGGVGIVWRPMTYLQLALHGDADFPLPQRIESPYSVYTSGNTVQASIGTELTIRVR